MDEPPGLNQLEQFRKRYPFTIRLNPRPLSRRQNNWTRTYLFFARLLLMYDLAAEGGYHV